MTVMYSRGKKWYDKNEREVMEELGLQATRASGAGWIEKEDGQSAALIAQLKSTDKSSMIIHKQDIDTLRHNALVAHKTPIFVIQFIQSGELYVLCKLEDIHDIHENIFAKRVDKPVPLCYTDNMGKICTKNKNATEVQSSTPREREELSREYGARFKRRK